MNTVSMTKPHGKSSPGPWQWQLSSQTVRRFKPAPGARWLAVEDGRVWLTRSQRELEAGEDVWLQAGDRHLLPPGSEWVAEGWPEASVLMLEAP